MENNRKDFDLGEPSLLRQTSKFGLSTEIIEQPLHNSQRLVIENAYRPKRTLNNSSGIGGQGFNYTES